MPEHVNYLQELIATGLGVFRCPDATLSVPLEKWDDRELKVTALLMRWSAMACMTKTKNAIIPSNHIRFSCTTKNKNDIIPYNTYQN